MYLFFKRFFYAAGLIALAFGSMATQAQAPTPAKPAVATFAGGCFWCMEEAFDKVKGVIKTTSGYTGGHLANPTYHQVTGGGTGHTEAVQVMYDPARISYAQLVDIFWQNIDPTQANGQFCDLGNSYRSEIFYHDDLQRKTAEASKATLIKNKPFKGNIVTAVTAAGPFYEAEGYHQDYHIRNPVRYKFYKSGCGREARLKELWGAK
jgi:peptide-methionine (S)-S-oxide reductase